MVTRRKVASANPLVRSPGLSQNPRRGFGPFGPGCCPTLLVAVRAGLPQRLLLFMPDVATIIEVNPSVAVSEAEG